MNDFIPIKGRLLIAEPSILNDTSFGRAIILLTEHTDNNSVGFILNRPLNYTLNDIIPEIDCDFNVYQGGPVEQDNLYFIHRRPELIPDSIEVANGVFWGGNFESLKALLNNHEINRTDIRFFLGYSGWGKQQLESEIELQSWFVSKNNLKDIFKEDDEFWKREILQKGGLYKIWANAPADVSLN